MTDPDSEDEQSESEYIKVTDDERSEDERSESVNNKHGFVQSIESLAIKNKNFRQVLYTAKNCQLVVMSLKSKESIGSEIHQVDQFFRVESGSGLVEINGVRTQVESGSAILVPAGALHNIINTGRVPLKLYTLYSPPNHRDGTIHRTKDEAESDTEHFDGKTTE